MGRSLFCIEGGNIMRRSGRALYVSLILAIVLSLPTCVFSFDSDKTIANIWNKAMDKLERALMLLDEMKDLPDKKILAKDKEDNIKKFNNIISDVLEIISSSEAKEIRDNIIKLRAKKADKEKEIREYQQKRVVAPEEGGLFVTTRQEYDEKIQKLNNEIEEIKHNIEVQTDNLIEVLNSYGISVSYNEIQGLLNTVTGYDLAVMYGSFNNIKIITDKLVKLMEENQNDIEAQKKYYGIYALLLKTCVFMEAGFIDKVNSTYYPKLEDIYNQSKELLSNAQEQLNSSKNLSANQKKSLESNIQSLNTHLKVIQQYREYLKKQCKQVKELQMKFESAYDVAFNTYRTLSVASDLLGMIKDSKKDLEILINLQVPEIIVFDNENLEREFKSISEQLL